MVKNGQNAEQRAEFARLVSGLDAFGRCRVILVLASFVEAWRRPPDIQERIHLARALWQRRN